MTWPELLQSDKLVLTPDDVAPILGCNPSAIREQAQRDARLLGFPVTITGSRVRIHAGQRGVPHPAPGNGSAFLCGLKRRFGNEHTYQIRSPTA